MSFIQGTCHTAFYVDDCLAGASTPEDALTLQQQLCELLMKGGFDLRKWRSSSKQVMDSIPTELHEPSQVKAIAEESPPSPQKTLGMHWDSESDNLFISVGAVTINEMQCHLRHSLYI